MKARCNKIKRINNLRICLTNVDGNPLHRRGEKSSAHDKDHWIRLFSFWLKQQLQCRNYSFCIARELN